MSSLAMGAREQAIFRAKPLTDPGIDLRRNRPKGVKGYDWKPQTKVIPKIPTKIPRPDTLCRKCEPMPVVFAESRCYHIQEIQHEVCLFFNVSQLDLVSHRRHAGIVRPRQIAMWLSRHLTIYSFPQIGRLFGHRDHTTVLHAIRKIDELRLKSPAIDDAVKSIANRLGAGGRIP